MSITITVTDPTREESLKLADYFFELAGYGKTAGVTSHRFEPNAEKMASLLQQQLEEMAGADDEAVVHNDTGEVAANLDTSTLGFGTARYATEPNIHATPEQQVVAAMTGVATPPAPPVAPVIPGNAQPTLGATDKDGYTWDARIHSSSKAINADGTWRLRKNLDVVTLHTVRAELKGDAVVDLAHVAELLHVPMSGNQSDRFNAGIPLLQSGVKSL